MMLLGVLVVAGAVGTTASQDAQPRPNVAEIEKVHDNLFLIKGGGGNTAAFITEKGVVLVDTKLANWGQAIMDKVRSVTDKPIAFIINTHTHGDHVGSNEFFPAAVEVVAHENTKANMLKMKQFAADKAQFLPDEVYTSRMTILSGADRVELHHYGAGHTNGDTIVVFPALRVAHTGDLFAGPSTPLIDLNNGGSGVAYPDTLRRAAEGITGVDTVIPGHTPTTVPWNAFVEFGEFNAAFLAAVQEAVTAGKTVEDTVTGLTLPEKFKAYGMGGAKANVEKIYGELKAAK
jgi:glyoxylase-like metal-dependent hydrolase (beta-lactamase superfamily II)